MFKEINQFYSLEEQDQERPL